MCILRPSRGPSDVFQEPPRWFHSIKSRKSCFYKLFINTQSVLKAHPNPCGQDFSSTMSTDANAPPSGEAPPWWAGLPEPRAACETIENSEVMSLLEKTLASPKEKRNFLLVDVRRNDWDGGTVATSINLPAQSLFQTRPVVYQLCKQAGIERVIFYCGRTFE